MKYLHITAAKPRNSKPSHGLLKKWLTAAWRAKVLVEPDLKMGGKGSFDL